MLQSFKLESNTFLNCKKISLILDINGEEVTSNYVKKKHFFKKKMFAFCIDKS